MLLFWLSGVTCGINASFQSWFPGLEAEATQQGGDLWGRESPVVWAIRLVARPLETEEAIAPPHTLPGCGVFHMFSFCLVQSLCFEFHDKHNKQFMIKQFMIKKKNETFRKEERM